MVPPDADLSDTTDMDDMTEDNIPTSPELAHDAILNGWRIFQLAHAYRDFLDTLTPLPWSAREDLQGTGSYYIAGPPESRVVAEGMRGEDAIAIVNMVNAAPALLEGFNDIAEVLALQLGVKSPVGEEVDHDDYLDIIDKYQLRLAQAEGSPESIPEVKVAGDLSFLHVGMAIDELPDFRLSGDLQIYTVTQVEKATIIRTGTSTIVLPSDTPISVRPLGERLRQVLQPKAPEAIL